jgi:uncharacterized hydrophobic protein (TIGR00271 family)
MKNENNDNFNRNSSSSKLGNINNYTVGAIIHYLKGLLDLNHGSDEEMTIEEIKSNIEFKGANIWILVFSIFVASIGLNVNSTAVIIGAMLISPLMGPILGVGLAIGINDFETLIKSVKNLVIAVTIAVITSTLYFAISPLSDAQSELLARTTPTIFDVFIALFGGLAGIVGTSRKLKGNVVPGVAIATALMPPLCTAGYGLATMNMNYFFGAFYLFFINSVFIALSTLLIVRIMKFHKKTFVDKEREKKARIYIAVFTIITVIPSIIIGFRVVQESYFNQRVSKYINENMDFPDSRVINTKTTFNSDSSLIEITLIGEIITENKIEELKKKLQFYSLDDTKLIVYQQKDNFGKLRDELNKDLKVGLLEDLYKRNEDIIKDKDKKIEFLETELRRYKLNEYPIDVLTREIKIVFPELMKFSFSNVISSNIETNNMDTIPTALTEWSGESIPKKRFEDWIKARLNIENLKIVTTKGGQ